jgi:geranylgeranyl reductase family protein
LVERFDAVVVGAGPAGSVAATVLARGGARVLLLDRVGFPRDKACGDLLSPRAFGLLIELGIDLGGTIPAGDMRLIGLSGHELLLPCPVSRTLPPHGLAVPRLALDDTLLREAVRAGAAFRRGELRTLGSLEQGARVFELADGSRVRTSFVVGADGAHSTVGQLGGLVVADEVIWAFALRYYVEAEVDVPTIVYLARDGTQPVPGYGWLFPGPEGRANLGVGVALGQSRTGAYLGLQLVPGFVERLRELGMVDGERLEARRGGWLKLALAGTIPARNGILLVGDAAALVNPLQGEGVAEAMMSGRAAAEAILAGGSAEAAYRRYLERVFADDYAANAAVHMLMLHEPRLFGRLGNVLTHPLFAPALGPGWATYWNQLTEEATPGIGRTVAQLLGRAAGLATRRSAVSRRIHERLESIPGTVSMQIVSGSERQASRRAVP